jgi:hypothetical protein
VRLDIWDCVESYGIYMVLTCRLKITFTSSLVLIISFFGINILIPSLDSHSSPVRVGMLLSCCISSLGPRGLLHNYAIPSRNLVTGVVIARTTPYVQLPADAPTRARFFWFTSDAFLKRPILLQY